MPELLTASAAARRRPDVFQKRLFLAAALALLLIAAALRFYHLRVRSLWFDEALTANMSRGTVAQLLAQQRLRGSAPVAHAGILYLVEKISISAASVRAPSVVASLLAVIVMLSMKRAGISTRAALFAAAIMAMSASQIRYAEEVREYSLAVLISSLLIFSLLRYEKADSRIHYPALLCVLLFAAPFVQYGLVFLGFGALSTIALRLLLARDTRFKPLHLLLASVCLAAGGLLSLALTLRYQFHPGPIWYLAANYYDPRTMSLFGYLGRNTKELLTFFVPGQLTLMFSAIAALVFCLTQLPARWYKPLTLLACTTMSFVIGAGLAKVYPYGGVRQCLYLSPLIILFAGVVMADLLPLLRRSSWQAVATVLILGLILFSGYRGLLRQWPYGEYEDTMSILRELARSSAPTDQVWVNHDAVEAVDFYLQGKDRRFIYGHFHGSAPQEYVPELLASIDARKDRFWLVFSHLQQASDRSEERLIVNTLRSGWDVRRVLAPMNTALYLAYPDSPR